MIFLICTIHVLKKLVLCSLKLHLIYFFIFLKMLNKTFQISWFKMIVSKCFDMDKLSQERAFGNDDWQHMFKALHHISSWIISYGARHMINTNDSPCAITNSACLLMKDLGLKLTTTNIEWPKPFFTNDLFWTHMYWLSQQPQQHVTLSHYLFLKKK